MRFLVDADLPRATSELLRRFGHTPIDVREVGLGAAKDSVIAAYAREHRLCLLTGDFDFSDMRTYPPVDYAGIIVLKLPRDATASFILSLIQSVLEHDRLLSEVSGKLAIVEPGRVRFRSRR
jgi:predicted nuclease of predicted toxin-antitoxin system